MTTAIAAAGLTKSFGPVRVLNGVDLAVDAGQLLAVLGPSGCGKTTILRVLAGFERADGGSVHVGGRHVAGPGVHVPPHRRGLAVVPQEGALFPHLDVAGNVGFGLPRGGGGARVAELLALAGLTGLEHRRPHELSGGQQQRVAVARALAPSPAVVLLDEPFSGLDAGLRASIRADVLHLLKAAGTTAVLVTHDQEEALSLADVVAIMRDGRLVQSGAPSDVYSRPIDLDVARFLGEADVLPGVARGRRVKCALGSLPVAGSTPAGPVTVMVRPEQLQLGGTVPAEVVSVSYFGHDSVVTARLVSGESLTVRTRGTDLPAPGSAVQLRVEGPVVCYGDA